MSSFIIVLLFVIFVTKRTYCATMFGVKTFVNNLSIVTYFTAFMS